MNQIVTFCPPSPPPLLASSLTRAHISKTADSIQVAEQALKTEDPERERIFLSISSSLINSSPSPKIPPSLSSSSSEEESVSLLREEEEEDEEEEEEEGVCLNISG